MATFTTHNSWGRTRSPKNLAGAVGTAITLSSAANLLGKTATSTGYATENQRYLHVLTEDNNGGSPGTIKVYGYCHAFLRWFELSAVQELSVSGPTDEEDLNADPTTVTIPVPTDSGHADAADITPDERNYRVYEIVGIDRVAFVGSTAHTSCFAACSTF